MMRSTIGLDRSKISVMHGTGPISTPNYRDASGGVWKQPATPIAPPSLQRNGASNPYQFKNNLRPTGNPIARQTVLSTAQGSSSLQSSHPHKRQRMDPLVASPYFSGKSCRNGSSARGTVPSHDSDPEIREVSPPSPRRRRQRHSFPNDTEVMILNDLSEDIGELVVRIDVDKTGDRSSPDPLAILPLPESRRLHDLHDFDTRPGELSSKRRKDQELDAFNRPVSPSEPDDDIEEFSSDHQFAISALKSPAIPRGIVQRNRTAFEPPKASVSSRTKESLHGVPALNFVGMPHRPTIVGKMKPKDQVLDPALASSGLTDSRTKRNTKLTLPLEVWYLGHVEFSCKADDPPQKLEYETDKRKLTITTGQPPRKFMLMLDRDVDGVTVTNNDGGPLKGGVVVQFQTTRSNNKSALKKWESEFKGQFQGGGPRNLAKLTLVFSTNRDLGWNDTDYQRFVKSVGEACRIEVIRTPAAASLLEMTKNFADMANRQQSKPGHKESGVAPSTATTRSSTPSSSSIKEKVPTPVPKPPDPEEGPSDRRRSLRQSTAQSAKAPLSPPAVAEPDELFLVYPPGTGALNIMRSDMKRLGPEEYLNDTLIEFGLKLWLNGLREKDPTLADQIHVFSSFFYKKLNNKKNLEEGYQSVRKWTSKVDLFSKKYIIVPINENVHWYLAIIYEPGHMLEPPLAVQPSPSRTTRNRAKGHGRTNAEAGPVASTSSGQGGESSTSSKEATRATTPSVTQDEDMEDITTAAVKLSCSNITSIKPGSKSSIRATSTGPSDLVYPTSPSRGDAMDVDVEPIDVDDARHTKDDVSKRIFGSASVPVTRFYGPPLSSKKEEKLAGEAVVVVDSEDEDNDRRQEAEVSDMLATQTQSPARPSQTYIFTLDSLGTRHPQAIKVLKHYLAQEAKDKRGFDEVRDPIGKQVHVPYQPNSWDCGIYLLHLTKVFMSNPEHYFNIITTRKNISSTDRKTLWKDHDVPLFRDHLAERITQLAEVWKSEKAAKDGEGKKRKSEEMEAEVVSSEGEIDIVDVSGEHKAKPQRRVRRLRG